MSAATTSTTTDNCCCSCLISLTSLLLSDSESLLLFAAARSTIPSLNALVLPSTTPSSAQVAPPLALAISLQPSYLTAPTSTALPRLRAHGHRNDATSYHGQAAHSRR